MPADTLEAAKYLVMGLELENKRCEALDSDSGNTSMDTSLGSINGVTSLNIELILDLSSSLCDLYRHGKIQAPGGKDSRTLNGIIGTLSHHMAKGKQRLHDTHDVTTRHSNGHAPLLSPILTSSLPSKAEDKHSDIWNAGAAIAKPLAFKIEYLLGIHTEAHTMLPPTYSPTSHAVSPSPNMPNGQQRAAMKKSVSFSKLPPKLSKSSLNASSARQARAVLIYLYYIAALVSFSHSHIDEARTYWETICALGETGRDGALGSGAQSPKTKTGAGGGSGSNSALREAEDIIAKAKIRLDMLETQSVPPASPYDLRTPLVGEATQAHTAAKSVKRNRIRSSELLSPPLSGDNGKHGYFPHVSAMPHWPRSRSSHDREHKHVSHAADSACEKAQGRPDASSISSTANRDHTSDHQDTDPGVQTAGTRRRNHRSAKFSIPDSPVSTIRSRAHSNSSAASATRSTDDAGQSTTSARPDVTMKVPWKLRRPTSSTYLSIDTQHGLHSPQRHASAPVVLHRASQLASPPPKQAHVPRLPKLAKSSGKSSAYWSVRSVSTPLTMVNEPAAYSLAPPVDDRYMYLRRNDTSVTSLPHYSSARLNHRSPSLAHSLLSGQPLRRAANSSASLVSLGFQKSYTSLRNFFGPTSGLIPESTKGKSVDYADAIEEGDSDDDTHSEGSIVDRDEHREQADSVNNGGNNVRDLLKAIVQRHDEAHAEIQEQLDFWRAASDEESHEESPEPIGANTFTPPRRAQTKAVHVPSPLRSDYAISPDRNTTSPGRARLPLSMSIPSSQLQLPSSGSTLPLNPPPSPSSTRKKSLKRERRPRRNKNRTFLDPTTHTPARSPDTSGHTTPLADEEHSAQPGEDGHYAKAVSIDPLLAALEAASRVNVKSRCAVCGKQGVNFPKCQKCDMTFCSRDCRMAQDSHACV